jgi:ABC-2 type transport system permease protein
MRNILIILRRELFAYFYSPIAYICLFVTLIVCGTIYWVILLELSNPRFQELGGAMAYFFGPVMFIWVLPICPALTMRLLAEERRTGTIEILMTAPVTEAEVVLAKFLGAFLFYGLLWTPSLVYVFILSLVADPDPGPIFTGYVGALVVGMLFVSVGTFTSSLTRNQIVAYIMALVINLLLMIAGIFTVTTQNARVKSLISYINIFDHFQNFSRGIIDTKNLVYYFSLTAFTLFVTVRVLESRKWR